MLSVFWEIKIKLNGFIKSKKIKQSRWYWNERIKIIKKIFKAYDPGHIAKVLFVSSLWLPNNGSKFKHQYLFTILASMNPEEFSRKRKISSFKEYKNLCKSIFPIIPEFPMLEDYYPAFDWGSIRYPFEEKQYKIFYGTEIENIYDYLQSFEIMYFPYDDDYLKTVNKSPVNELKIILELQDMVINSLKTQPSEKEIDKLPLGNIEIATKGFWIEASNLFVKLSNKQSNEKLVDEDYIVNLGSIEIEKKIDDFGQNAYEGKLIPAIFLKDETKYYPMLLRRCSEIIFERWNKLYSSYRENPKYDKKEYRERINYQLSRFLYHRFHPREYYPFVSAVYKDDIPHDLVYFGMLLDKNAINLFCCLEPNNDSKMLEEDIKQIQQKIQESINLIQNSPMTLALHRDGKNLRFEKGIILSINVYLVTPLTTMNPIPLRISREMQDQIFPLDQFLAIMDEMESVDEFFEFMSFLKTTKKLVPFPLTSMTDFFAAFKDSSNVLIPGPIQPNLIMIDPSWGSNFRYESLKEFWGNYPEVNFLDNPREWKLFRDGDLILRLESKSSFTVGFYLKILSTNIFLTSPFGNQNFEDISLSDLLIGCIKDYFSRFIKELARHTFFSDIDEMRIFIFPNTILDNQEFDYIRHLNPLNHIWEIDHIFLPDKFFGIRLVYNREKVFEEFRNRKNNEAEISVVVKILNEIQDFHPDDSFNEIIKSFEKVKGNLPRFTTVAREKLVAFPQFAKVEIPEDKEHKLARKKEAELAYSIGINPGIYDLDSSKIILDNLRIQMIREFEKEISNYNFSSSIPYIISKIDALINYYDIEKRDLVESIEREVDYARDEKYSSLSKEFIGNFRNFRYLLEKFVQIQPSGLKTLDAKSIRYLVAFVDKINEIYFASDNIHYQVFPAGLEIDQDYHLKVDTIDDLNEKQERFFKDRGRFDLSLVGNPQDKVELKQESGILDEIDRAFYLDYGFGFSNMLSILSMLSRWSFLFKNKNEETYYFATVEEIASIAEREIKDFNIEETGPIIEFLTLKNEKMLDIIDQKGLADDLPVWEYSKRPQRYSIRPLIRIEDQIYWGPHSVAQSGINWVGRIMDATLPVRLDGQNIEKTLQKYRQVIEQQLEDNAKAICRRFTPFVENVNYSRGTHPQSLGEYDALAYFEKQNLLINIECKDISSAFCLKDARRIRDKIFRNEYEESRKVKSPGNLLIVEKRENYLKKNYRIFAEILNWPIKRKPKVLSIYITRRDYWWTKFPPRKTNVIFLRVDMLYEYLTKILTKVSE